MQRDDGQSEILISHRESREAIAGKESEYMMQQARCSILTSGKSKVGGEFRQGLVENKTSLDCCKLLSGLRCDFSVDG